MSKDNVSSTNGSQRIPVVTYTARGIAKNRKIILICDSILHRINPKVLVKDIQKLSRGDAK